MTTVDRAVEVGAGGFGYFWQQKEHLDLWSKVTERRGKMEVRVALGERQVNEGAVDSGSEAGMTKMGSQ